MQLKNPSIDRAGWNLTLAQKVRLGLLVASALYVVVWGFAVWSLIRWGRDIEWVVRANQSMTQLERVLSGVEATESGQRGYILTGRPNYLADYEAAVRDTNK